MQLGPIKQAIFIRPPKKHRCKRGTLRKLLNLPYGIVEAERQWHWLLSEPIGFERVEGVTQLFLFRHRNGNVRMLCANVTEVFLFSGCAKDHTWFDSVLLKCFKVGKMILSGLMNFKGGIVEQTESDDMSLLTAIGVSIRNGP